jgi:hypothetical protein
MGSDPGLDYDRTTASNKRSTKMEALDTTILDRIRKGRGPRDEALEDLLAPLRRGNLRDESTSYSVENE